MTFTAIKPIQRKPTEDTIEFYTEFIHDLATIEFLGTLFDFPPCSLPYFWSALHSNIPIQSDPLILHGLEWHDPYVFDPTPPTLAHPSIWVGCDVFEDVEFLFDLHRVPFPFDHGSILFKAIRSEFSSDSFSSIYLKYSFEVNHWLLATDKALDCLYDSFTNLNQDFSRWVEINTDEFNAWLDYVQEHFPSRDCDRKIEIIREVFL